MSAIQSVEPCNTYSRPSVITHTPSVDPGDLWVLEYRLYVAEAIHRLTNSVDPEYYGLSTMMCYDKSRLYTYISMGDQGPGSLSNVTILKGWMEFLPGTPRKGSYIQPVFLSSVQTILSQAPC